MMPAREVRRAFLALSDLTHGGISLDTMLEWHLDELQEWLDDAVEWRREVNKANGS